MLVRLKVELSVKRGQAGNDEQKVESRLYCAVGPGQRQRKLSSWSQSQMHTRVACTHTATVLGHGLVISAYLCCIVYHMHGTSGTTVRKQPYVTWRKTL